MSSPFQKNFSAKSPMSPLNGAYASGADAMVTVSDAGHFAKLQSDIKGATLTAMNPKVSKCDSIRNNWHAGKMTDKAYADASKDCGETKDKIDLSEDKDFNENIPSLKKVTMLGSNENNDNYNGMSDEDSYYYDYENKKKQ